MNRSLVLRLILKDWYLNRSKLAIIAAAGVLSVGSLYLRIGIVSVTGMISALTATIFLSILMPMSTVVHERKQQNLAFVMSLPISPMQYTTAKVVGNLVAFLVVWLAIALGIIGTIASAKLYGGVIPLAVIAALAPFVAFALLLAVAIISESEAWAVTVMATCNVSYSFVWLFLSRIPGFAQDLKSPVAIWSQPVLTIVAVEIALIVLSLAATFYFQSRKTDFI